MSVGHSPAKEAERKIREDLDEVIDSLTRDKP